MPSAKFPFEKSFLLEFILRVVTPVRTSHTHFILSMVFLDPGVLSVYALELFLHYLISYFMQIFDPVLSIFIYFIFHSVHFHIFPTIFLLKMIWSSKTVIVLQYPICTDCILFMSLALFVQECSKVGSAAAV
jgi:hypothetical protein